MVSQTKTNNFFFIFDEEYINITIGVSLAVFIAIIALIVVHRMSRQQPPKVSTQTKLQTLVYEYKSILNGDKLARSHGQIAGWAQYIFVSAAFLLILWLVTHFCGQSFLGFHITPAAPGTAYNGHFPASVYGWIAFIFGWILMGVSWPVWAGLFIFYILVRYVALVDMFAITKH